MSKWQAVVFDLDDTLYPEHEFVLSGFRAVAQWSESQLGIASGKGLFELTELFKQGVRHNTFDQWLDLHKLRSDRLVQQVVEVYRTHQPMIRPYPETPPLLGKLHTTYRLGLVSDGYLPVQQSKLAGLGLAQHFDAIVFSDEWGREAWKPSGMPFRAILKRLKVEATSAVYVADNPVKDFLGARSAGMFAIRLRLPGGEYALLEPIAAEYAPDMTLESFAELEQVLTTEQASWSVTAC